MEEITVAKNFVRNFNAKRRGISNYFESLEDYEDIEPIVIGRNVSKEHWEKFVRHLAERDNIDRCLSLRFTKLENKEVQLVDMPSVAHVSIEAKLNDTFLLSCGNWDEIGQYRDVLVRNSENKAMEADLSYGPMDCTINRKPRPRISLYQVWLTFVVEVAVWETWTNLDKRAADWSNLPGIKYILCLKISMKMQRFGYKFYHISDNGNLSLHRSAMNLNNYGLCEPAEEIILNGRKLLAIRAGLALPNGVNEFIKINLREIFVKAARSVSSSFM